MLGLGWGQFGLGTNVYGGVVDFDPGDRARDEIVHEVPLSPSKPVKDLGVRSFVVTVTAVVDPSGAISSASTSIFALISDAETVAPRNLSFSFAGEEVYFKVGAGGVSDVRTINPRGGDVGTVRLQEVTLTFRVHDTRLYAAIGDRVILGG